MKAGRVGRIDKAGTDRQTGKTKPSEVKPWPILAARRYVACSLLTQLCTERSGSKLSRKIPRLSAARSRKKTRNRCRGSRRPLAARIFLADFLTDSLWE